jgi:hypothetical protein
MVVIFSIEGAFLKAPFPFDTDWKNPPVGNRIEEV